MEDIVGAITSFSWPWRSEPPSYRVKVFTGDRRGAGTDSDVFIQLRDSKGRASVPIRANHFYKNDNERDSSTVIELGSSIGVEPPFTDVQVWKRDGYNFVLFQRFNSLFFGGPNRGSADWYVDRIEVHALQSPHHQRGVKGLITNESAEMKWIFPVHRWIEYGEKWNISLYDCVLPQEDKCKGRREAELNRKREVYRYKMKVQGGPVQAAELPPDEEFSEAFYFTFLEKKVRLMASSMLIEWTASPWKSIEDLKKVYSKSFARPQATEYWKKDWWFGLQRLQGIDCSIIKLCKKLPDKFQWNGDEVEPLLEGKSLIQITDENRLFICDLEILENLPCKEGRQLAAPIALFFRNSGDNLVPIAIQMGQEKDRYPVFTPRDPESTWLVAKMFYNNAEAQYHQSVSHLGYTHLLMEGVCVCTHRCLSPSHPLFRLLAPHFLYLIAINSRGEDKLINPGGWVDTTMTQGSQGMFALMARRFEKHSFNSCNPEKDFRMRGVEDPAVLPSYPYRDDRLPLFRCIKTYVTQILRRYYGSSEVLQQDQEVKKWREELAAPPEEGVGLKNLPGCDIKGFTSVEELIETASVIIATCSLGHAAVNTQQYEQYAFVPNYPGMLHMDPPETKREYTEEEIMAMLPSQKTTLEIMVITHLLSTPITNSLGNFEVTFMYHPEDMAAAQRFREALLKESRAIAQRNMERRLPYTALDPSCLPNSISI